MTMMSRHESLWMDHRPGFAPASLFFFSKIDLSASSTELSWPAGKANTLWQGLLHTYFPSWSLCFGLARADPRKCPNRTSKVICIVHTVPCRHMHAYVCRSREYTRITRRRATSKYGRGQRSKYERDHGRLAECRRSSGSICAECPSSLLPAAGHDWVQKKIQTKLKQEKKPIITCEPAAG